jgi:hypothetical protein
MTFYRSMLLAKVPLSPASFYVLGCMLIGPLLLILFPQGSFLNDNHCDAWYVFGLFHNLPEMVKWWPNDRQTGRFAEILPGFLLTRLLPGVYSDYAHFLCFFTLSAYLIFKTVEAFFSRPRAALATIFFCFSPFIIGTYGVTYDSPVITYEIVSLFGVARALTTLNPRYRLGWMLLSGLGWGAAMNAHLASSLFGAYSYLFFALRVFLERSVSLRSRISIVAAAAVFVLVGVILLNLSLGLLAALVFKTSPWIVFNQVYVAARIFAQETNQWIPSWYSQGANTGMYLLGLATACVCFIYYLQRARHERQSTVAERHTLAITLSFVLSFGVWFVYDMLGGVFLQYEYYFILMWPFLTLTIFAGDIGWDAESQFRFVLVFLIACCLGIIIRTPNLANISRATEAEISVVIAFGVAVLFSVALRIENGPRRTILAAGTLLLLSLMTLVARPHKMGYQLFHPPGGEAPINAYARLHAGVNFVDWVTKGARSAPVFWTNPAEIPDAIPYASSFLACEFGYFPAVGADISNSQTGDFIVVIARPENLLDRIKVAIRDLKLDVKVIDTMVLKDDRGPYSILITSVTKQESH